MRMAKDQIPAEIDVPGAVALFGPGRGHGHVIDHMLNAMKG
jgi:hypothetical protein